MLPYVQGSRLGKAMGGKYKRERERWKERDVERLEGEGEAFE